MELKKRIVGRSPRMTLISILAFVFYLFDSAPQISATHHPPPFFKQDLNNHVIVENTPVGTSIFQLVGVDPDGPPTNLRYGIMGTDKLSVDESTGVVTISKPIDREVEDQLKVSVTVQSDDGNLVVVKNVVQIADENDNHPKFTNEESFNSIEVIEDTRVGTKILSVLLKDPDLTGVELSLKCVPTPPSMEACDVFPIEILDASSGHLKSEMRLGQKLDYNKRSMYQFTLTASDGEHESKVNVLIRIRDVQNTPPAFVGAMSGRVMEDAQVGTLVMIVEARDGDLGHPRQVKLTLTKNPGDSFQLDPTSGYLVTTRPLDRETLGTTITLEVKAQELPRSDEPTVPFGPADIKLLETLANITVLIDDVNDFSPKFNQKEFWTEINENSPVGSPLPELDIEVTDQDSGTFADFTLKIEGPLSELFDIEPKIGSGYVRPVIRIKKSFDFENPNERKYLILIVAQNIEEPELYSTCTISVSVVDENDNRPKFAQDVYTLSVPESAEPGTKIGQITARDPDSGEYGDEGIVYQLVGSGNKKFTVNPKSGEIFLAKCPTFGDNHTVTPVQNCLDYEIQKVYDLLYMASDSYKMAGFIHSIVPVQIQLEDSNDNPPFFESSKYSRVIFENSNHFEPRFFVRGSDIDKSSILEYKLVAESGEVKKYFLIDETSSEISIRNPILPPGNYSFNVTVSDGQFSSTAPVFITVIDINNNYPAFNSSMPRDLTINEDSEIGTLLLQLDASDGDFGFNSKLFYTIESGGFDYWDVEETNGEIRLIKPLNDTEISEFELVVSASDFGTPPLRSMTTLHVKIIDVYTPLPNIYPTLQRIQVAESAQIGDLIGQIQIVNPTWEKLSLSDSDLKLKFEFVDPIEARNLDNKAAIMENNIFQDWFTIDASGQVRIGSSGLSREMVTGINLTVLLTSETSKPGSTSVGTLAITIFDVNIQPPRIEDVEIETYEELPLGMSILTLTCDDPEGGQISNYYIQDKEPFVSIDNKTGEIKISGRMDYEDRPIYNFTVVCVDSGLPQLSSTGTVMVSLLNINDNPPVFNESVYSAEVLEHSKEGTHVTSVYATDKDGDVLYYDIESGPYSNAFRIDRVGHITVSKDGTTILDREIMSSPYITLGIRAKDSKHHGFSTVSIRVKDKNDVWPKIVKRSSYHTTIFSPLRSTQEIMKISAIGGDQDDTDDIRFKIHSGNDIGLFEIDSKTGILSAARAFEDSGEFRLVIEVTDKKDDTTISGDHYDRAGIFIKVLEGNFRKPEFKFPNRVNSTLPALESDAEEIAKFAEGDYTKVLGQLLAFDNDEGEAGEINYFFKEGENLVTDLENFRVEMETGIIHLIKPLDREEMNVYNLVVVAKDNGNPVSTETQEILNIVVEDIDDNFPLFPENRTYNFSIKENSLENTVIGHVKARDEDEGRNGQIFYFLVATEENQHYLHNDIRVDIKAGTIYTNAVLDHERINNYLFFVRASPSPMANKSASIMKLEDVLTNPSVAIVHVQILDLNDNSPRFTAREYYAGINSNSEPGRELLTFESTDPDPSSQPFIQYSLQGSYLLLDDVKSSGAVLPSPFRIEPSRGRLTISPSTIRRYAGGNNRFLVKVGVKETIPPYYQDTTHVKVWIVENNQESVLTIKTPPHGMLRKELKELLGNITGRLILINKITPHILIDGNQKSVRKDWSDVYITAIDKISEQILPVAQFLQELDLGHDKLLKSGLPIELFSAIPALGSKNDLEGHGGFFNERESFDTAFAGLVALVALLCMGMAFILAVCCCLNRMYTKRSDKSSQMSSNGMKYPLQLGDHSLPGTPTMSRSIITGQQPEMIENLATTDNPLWIDHKLKTYEEQELTMQVASDLENSNGTDDGISVADVHEQNHSKLTRQNSSQFSHAYATLHPHPNHRHETEHEYILNDEAVHL